MAAGWNRGRHIKRSAVDMDKRVSDPVGLLAAEIVISAVNDWRDLIKAKAWLNDGIGNKWCNFYELRQFFRSDWCGFLMQGMDNIEPTRLLAILEAELQEAKAKYERERKNKK